MKEISNIKISLLTGPNGECPFCNRNGYVRFMREAATVNGPSLRMDDILVGVHFRPWNRKSRRAFPKRTISWSK